MTTYNVTATAAQEYTLTDAISRVHFHGWRIADISSEKLGQTRWTTMQLYKTASGKYALVITGESLLYHATGAGCNAGTPTAWDDLDPDAVACDQCAPTRADLIEMEDPFPKLHTPENPAEVIARLQQPHRITQELVISRPAQRLLAEAARNDPAFQPDTREL